MKREIEIKMLDMTYEPFRMRDSTKEARLLASIAQHGIEQPLEGVDIKENSLLLNGFKRYRCAQKLGIGFVPYVSLGEDVPMGIFAILRISNTKGLSILEQARFIDELKMMHKMNVTQIAEHLCKSKSWVSMRLELIVELTDTIKEKLFNGSFPVYSYMYTVRKFMRMNSVKKDDIEEFVLAVSGKKLSIREIEYLANGYFRGPESFREQIRSGHIDLALEQIRDVPQDSEGCNEFERVLLKDLEITQKYMKRVIGKSMDPRLKTQSFYAQVNLLTAGILSKSQSFFQILKELHDRSGQA